MIQNDKSYSSHTRLQTIVDLLEMADDDEAASGLSQSSCIKTRNLSEKRRRDQFNSLVAELGAIVSKDGKKLDKSGILRATISFLRGHNESMERHRLFEIDADWKPPFLSNDEFSHIMMEAVDAFCVSFKTSGTILHLSSTITSLLHLLPKDLIGTDFFDLVHVDDRVGIKKRLESAALEEQEEVEFQCHLRSNLEEEGEARYEPVSFLGILRRQENAEFSFLGTGRLSSPTVNLLKEVTLIEPSGKDLEFTSRHSLEWKFLFLDSKASPIIGYMPFEILGHSGYEYIHMDDLADLVLCHEELLRKGEGNSGYYRFLSKGQQYIWLKTHYYITYHQWNSRPEFIMCKHQVKTYEEVLEGRKMESAVRQPSEAQRRLDRRKREEEARCEMEDPSEEGMELSEEALQRMDRKHRRNSGGSSSGRSGSSKKKRRRDKDEITSRTSGSSAGRSSTGRSATDEISVRSSALREFLRNTKGDTKSLKLIAPSTSTATASSSTYPSSSGVEASATTTTTSTTTSTSSSSSKSASSQNFVRNIANLLQSRGTQGMPLSIKNILEWEKAGKLTGSQSKALTVRDQLMARQRLQERQVGGQEQGTNNAGTQISFALDPKIARLMSSVAATSATLSEALIASPVIASSNFSPAVIVTSSILSPSAVTTPTAALATSSTLSPTAVIATPATSTTPKMPATPTLLNAAQKLIQEQLIQKHNMLQQQIKKQQEDLRIVTEQLALLQQMEALAQVPDSAVAGAGVAGPGLFSGGTVGGAVGGSVDSGGVVADSVVGGSVVSSSTVGGGVGSVTVQAAETDTVVPSQLSTLIQLHPAPLVQLSRPEATPLVQLKASPISAQPQVVFLPGESPALSVSSQQQTLQQLSPPKSSNLNPPGVVVASEETTTTTASKADGGGAVSVQSGAAIGKGENSSRREIPTTTSTTTLRVSGVVNAGHSIFVPVTPAPASLSLPIGQFVVSPATQSTPSITEAEVNTGTRAGGEGQTTAVGPEGQSEAKGKGKADERAL